MRFVQVLLSNVDVVCKSLFDAFDSKVQLVGKCLVLGKVVAFVGPIAELFVVLPKF
jgi:hypothetical protein